MSNFTAADVKRLREATAAGMLDCKNALVEAEGEFEKAVEILRVKGLKGVTKREGRSASNGLVTAKLDGTSSGVLLELNCETDFVAKGERFQAVAAEIVDIVAANKPADVSALLETKTTNGQTVQELVDEANATLGEKIEIRRFAILDHGYIGSYLHKTSPDLPPQVGVIVELSGENSEIAKGVAQHIAAFPPIALSSDDVPADVIANERRVLEEAAREDGKPDAAISKIVDGQIAKFIKENVVLDQGFAKDMKKTVKQVLDEAGVSLQGFARFRVGS
jgi:elongation factor Ts